MSRQHSHDSLTDYRSIIRAGQEGLRPEPLLRVSEWADQFRILPPTSALPGRWHTHRTPYLREIMDCLSPSHPAEEVTMMKGAQTGGSEGGLNWVGYVIHHAPGLMLLVMPSLDMVKRNTSTRINPLVESTPELKERVVEPRSRDGGNSIFRKRFPGGELVMTGANSAVGLRSTPARYLFLDEVDGYPGDADGEGDPVDLATQRTVTFRGRRKILKVSTPTVKGQSRIERSYEESDQRRYFVPCLHCGEYSVIRWEDIKWPKGEDGQTPEPEKAAWYCPSCGAEHLDHQKAELLERGEWRATAPGDGRHVGFHLSALYSPWETWAEIAELWEKVQKDPSRLKVFINTKLGQTWEERGEAPEWERLYERREHYPIGSVPSEALILTAGVDVQMDRIEIEVVGWGADKQSWSIQYEVLMGDTANLNGEAWTKLEAMLGDTWPRANGIQMPLAMTAIDEGYRTQEVRTWARRFVSSRVMVCKGTDHASVPVGLPSKVDINLRGQRIARGQQVWPIGVSLLKTELYGWLRMSKPTEEAIEAGASFPPGYCHHPEYGEEYFRQLTAEQLVKRVHKGYVRFEWQKTRERNEVLDCRVYARAAAIQVKVDRLTDSEWERLRAQFEPGDALPPGGAPQPAAAGQRRRPRVQRSSYMGRR